MVSTKSYFRRLSETEFQATEQVVGAWNVSEQHIAPTIGLLTHLIERDHVARGGQLRLARVACDILGVLTLDPVEVVVRVIRPGRTIELIEAELSQHGRTAVIARGWMLQRIDTAEITGTAYDPMPAIDSMEPFEFGERWPGNFVKTVEARKQETEPGRAQVWIRPLATLLENEQVSATARMLGVIDVSNGMTPRVDPYQVVFPNLDLAISVMREPNEGWVGLDIRVSFGPDGTGITHTVLHDEAGPVGALMQTLTVRPLG
jgi:hypothetical protein